MRSERSWGNPSAPVKPEFVPGDVGPLLAAAEQKKSRLGLLPKRPLETLASDNRRGTPRHRDSPCNLFISAERL
jgi:hypothetical protein